MAGVCEKNPTLEQNGVPPVKMSESGGCPFAPKVRKPFVLNNLLNGTSMTDTLHQKASGVSQPLLIHSLRVSLHALFFGRGYFYYFLAI